MANLSVGKELIVTSQLYGHFDILINSTVFNLPVKQLLKLHDLAIFELATSGFQSHPHPRKKEKERKENHHLGEISGAVKVTELKRESPQAPLCNLLDK